MLWLYTCDGYEIRCEFGTISSERKLQERRSNMNTRGGLRCSNQLILRQRMSSS